MIVKPLVAKKFQIFFLSIHQHPKKCISFLKYEVVQFLRTDNKKCFLSRILKDHVTLKTHLSSHKLHFKILHKICNNTS